jgi:hypothetical protein
MGFDDPYVFVDRAIGGPDFDGAEVHAVNYHDKKWVSQGNFRRFSENLGY